MCCVPRTSYTTVRTHGAPSSLVGCVTADFCAPPPPPAAAPAAAVLVAAADAVDSDDDGVGDGSADIAVVPA